MNHKLKIFAGVFLSSIVLISIAFPYPIHIADALTLEVLPEYDIHVSIWRYLFEPALGVILFFNRASYAVAEFPFVLVWVLAIFIFYGLVKSIVIIDKQAKKRFIIRQVVNLPMVIGLWFTVFVILIFIPLPNNTIVNNSPNSVLVTTHSHTDYSHDGLISQRGLWKWHKRNGFDAFFITDHNNHDKTVDFVNAQRNNEFPIEPLVLGGEEFSGTNHMSLLGLKRKFSTKGYSDSRTIDSVRANGGAVIVNHWFDDENKSMKYYRELGVDGFEIENTALDKTYDREMFQKMKSYLKKNNLIMNGGLDFHGYGNACSLWNAFEIPGWHKMTPDAKEYAILDIIKTRDQEKLKVLLYKDRPFYLKKNLVFSPVLTLVNYFRTLNLYQLISWIFWISFVTLMFIAISKKPELMKRLDPDWLIPVKGILSALFILGLGFVYHSKIESLVQYNDMYVEYANLLFYAGGAFLIYSAIVTWFRIFRKKI